MQTERTGALAPEKIDLRPYPWPQFSEAEIDSVTQILKSGQVNYWTGRQGKEFEAEFSGYFGNPYSVAMANGTVTLQACLRVLGIGPGDEVITTPRTFIGTSSAIVMEGAIPVMADVDRCSGNITAETIERVLSSRTRAILPVHLAGWPCEMEPILDLAKSRDLFVIEDCAQSHGATYKGRHVGTLGDLGSWSFCQDKVMSTGGEGGMVGTSNPDLWNALWAVKDHGKSFDTVFHKPHPPGFRWLHESWGTNWRMTEIQAAIGRLQLKMLPVWTEKRTENARILQDALSGIAAVRVPEVPGHMSHAYYKFYVYVRPEFLKDGWSRDRLLAEFNQYGVPGLSGSCSEIYLEKAFSASHLGVKERLPVAQELGETSIMFMVHPTLSSEAIHRVAEIAQFVLSQASR